MRQLILTLALLAAACGPPPSRPVQAEVTSLQVRDAWGTPTPGGVDVSAGYLTIINGTEADERLVSASSPRAGAVEIHEMSMEGAVMRMREVEGGLAIPRGETASLQPGGLHLMFVGVTQPFAEGEEIPVILTFEHAGTMDVTLPIRAMGAGGQDGH